jgi:hypothetical protein
MVAIPVPKNDPDGVLYKRATIAHHEAGHTGVAAPFNIRVVRVDLEFCRTVRKSDGRCRRRSRPFAACSPGRLAHQSLHRREMGQVARR